MIRTTLGELSYGQSRHFLSDILPSKYLSYGGLGFKTPGERTHDNTCSCDACDGEGHHRHDDHEVFIVLQGKAVMEIDGDSYPMTSGDVIVCEPGEDHHLIADNEEPCVNLWLHGSDIPHCAND